MTEKKWVITLNPSQTTDELEAERQHRVWADFENDLRQQLAWHGGRGRIRAVVNICRLTPQQRACACEELERLFGKDLIDAQQTQGQIVIKNAEDWRDQLAKIAK